MAELSSRLTPPPFTGEQKGNFRANLKNEQSCGAGAQKAGCHAGQLGIVGQFR